MGRHSESWYQETIAKLWALCGGELPDSDEWGHDLLSDEEVEMIRDIERRVDRRRIRRHARGMR